VAVSAEEAANDGVHEAYCMKLGDKQEDVEETSKHE